MMLDRLSSYVQAHALWNTDDRLLIAVSGGVDSMVLAHLIHRSAYNFGIAHMNYQLRGEASDADEALVKSQAQRWGVDYHGKRVSIDKEAENVQEQARALRYDFFEGLCTTHGYTHLLTAHHLDDRVETTLMNLARGTGIYGMKGIPRKRGRIVRPLLWAGREEIERYAAEQGVVYRTDQSNDELDYTRNRIRHEVMRPLKALDQNTLKRIEGSLDFLEQDAEVLNGLAQARVEQIGDAKVMKLDPNEKLLWAGLLYHGFRDEGLQRSEAAEMVLANVGARWEKLSHSFIRSSRHISLLPKEPLVTFNKKLSTDEVCELPMGTVTCLEHLGGEPSFDLRNRKVWLAMLPNQLPLTVRPLHESDVFTPLGLNYSVNIRKYLLEKGASYAHLRHTIVVCNQAGDICWVPEWQVAEEFKWQKGLEPIVSLSFEPNGD